MQQCRSNSSLHPRFGSKEATRNYMSHTAGRELQAKVLGNGRWFPFTFAPFLEWTLPSQERGVSARVVFEPSPGVGTSGAFILKHEERSKTCRVIMSLAREATYECYEMSAPGPPSLTRDTAPIAPHFLVLSQEQTSFEVDTRNASPSRSSAQRARARTNGNMRPNHRTPRKLLL